MYQHTIQVETSAYHHISVSAIFQQHQSSMHPVSPHCLSLVSYIHRQEYKIGRTRRNGMGRTSGRRCPMYQQWCIIIRTTSFAVECSLAFVCVVWAACVSTTSNCLAHHILSVVALPYAPRPSESPYAMSSSSPTPLFHPLLFYLILHVYCTPYTCRLPPPPFLCTSFIYCTLSPPYCS